MTEQTLKKANEIQQRINKLKKEVDWLNNRAGCGWFFRRIFGFRPVIKGAEKVWCEEIFDLEKNDVIALQDRRIKLIHELQDELHGLQDCKEEVQP